MYHMRNKQRNFVIKLSGDFAEVVSKLDVTIAISTYETGRVIFFGADKSGEAKSFSQLPRAFKRAMGIGVSENSLAIATQEEVIILSKIDLLSHQSKKYKSMYMPRCAYYSGRLDLHDIEIIDEKIIAVNTKFSCVCEITSKFSFEPIWQPEFITELRPEDRCHLNGMCFENGELAYLTALGKSNTKEGWRRDKHNGGILIDAGTSEIVLEGLSMPHSPRFHNGDLYMLETGKGRLLKVDVSKKSFEVVGEFKKLVRGLAFYADFVFMGMSKVRKNSKDFDGFDVSATSSLAGIFIYHLPSQEIIGALTYENTIDELFDVQVLPGGAQGIMNHYDNDHFNVITSPSGIFHKSKK